LLVVGCDKLIVLQVPLVHALHVLLQHLEFALSKNGDGGNYLLLRYIHFNGVQFLLRSLVLPNQLDESVTVDVGGRLFLIGFECVGVYLVQDLRLRLGFVGVPRHMRLRRIERSILRKWLLLLRVMCSLWTEKYLVLRPNVVVALERRLEHEIGWLSDRFRVPEGIGSLKTLSWTILGVDLHQGYFNI
jgi:hypothetical protein